MIFETNEETELLAKAPHDKNILDVFDGADRFCEWGIQQVSKHHAVV